VALRRDFRPIPPEGHVAKLSLQARIFRYPALLTSPIGHSAALHVAFLGISHCLGADRG
jgi:hypothetical protein